MQRACIRACVRRWRWRPAVPVPVPVLSCASLSPLRSRPARTESLCFASPHAHGNPDRKSVILYCRPPVAFPQFRGPPNGKPACSAPLSLPSLRLTSSAHRLRRRAVEHHTCSLSRAGLHVGLLETLQMAAISIRLRAPPMLIAAASSVPLVYPAQSSAESWGKARSVPSRSKGHGLALASRGGREGVVVAVRCCSGEGRQDDPAARGLRSWSWICRSACVSLARRRVGARLLPSSFCPSHPMGLVPSGDIWDRINLQLILGVGRGPRTMKRAHGPWGVPSYRTVRFAIRAVGGRAYGCWCATPTSERVDLRTLNKDSSLAHKA